MRVAPPSWPSGPRSSLGVDTMRRELLVPKLGLTMTEGVLVEWMVRPGEAFTAEQGLFVIESEKAANEIGAEADGVLLEVCAEVGATLPCGAVMGYWDDAPGLALAQRQAILFCKRLQIADIAHAPIRIARAQTLIEGGVRRRIVHAVFLEGPVQQQQPARFQQAPGATKQTLRGIPGRDVNHVEA